MQWQLSIKAIPLSRLSYTRSPQQFKFQDSNWEGGRLITTEDVCQKFFPRVSRCWGYSLKSESDKGECNKFSKAWDPQFYMEVKNATSQCLLQIPPPLLTHTYTHTHTHTHTHYSYTHWSVLMSLIPRSLKERELAIDYRFVTQRTTCTCLFFFLVYLWIYLSLHQHMFLDGYLHRALGKGEEKIFQISYIFMDSTNKILFY